MFPLIPLPEFLSALRPIHEMVAWGVFVTGGIFGLVLTVMVSVSYDGSLRDKIYLRFYVGIVSYSILSLVAGLYAVAPIMAAAAVVIVFYVGKGILIALFPDRF